MSGTTTTTSSFRQATVSASCCKIILSHALLMIAGCQGLLPYSYHLPPTSGLVLRQLPFMRIARRIRTSLLQSSFVDVKNEMPTSHLKSPLDDCSVLLANRTTECLDFEVLLRELKENSVTILGKELITSAFARSVQEVNLEYAMVDEISGQLSLVPLRSSIDVWTVLRQLEMGTFHLESYLLSKLKLLHQKAIRT